MKSNLVSIITPAFNTGKYIGSLLDSVLIQSYPNIEMIVVDDGSTDNTASIIKEYINKFDEKGYTLKYIFQENSGQSQAVSTGLEYINGEYLVWPDSDDFYASSEAIFKMVAQFEKLDDSFAMVRTQVSVISDDIPPRKLYINGFLENHLVQLLLKDFFLSVQSYLQPQLYHLYMIILLEQLSANNLVRHH